MPTFHCYRNGEFQGIIQAVSMKQARQRARILFGRCDVIGQRVTRVDGVAHETCSVY